MMFSMCRWLVVLGVVFGGAVLGAGCGPVAYIHQVTYGADDAVEAARAAGADKYSPYWWTRASEYLEMAREVAGHADYQGANKFGRLAQEAAKQALDEASNPAKRPVNPMEEATPAKDGSKAVAPAKDEPDGKPAGKAIAPAKEPKAIAPAKDTP
jgi:hypothetical protein